MDAFGLEYAHAHLSPNVVVSSITWMGSMRSTSEVRKAISPAASIVCCLMTNVPTAKINTTVAPYNIVVATGSSARALAVWPVQNVSIYASTLKIHVHVM